MMADYKKYCCIFLSHFPFKMKICCLKDVQNCPFLPPPLPPTLDIWKGPHLFFVFLPLYLGTWRWIKVFLTQCTVDYSYVKSHVYFSQVDQQRHSEIILFLGQLCANCTILQLQWGRSKVLMLSLVRAVLHKGKNWLRIGSDLQLL